MEEKTKRHRTRLHRRNKNKSVRQKLRLEGGGKQDLEAEFKTTGAGGHDREAEVNTTAGGGQDREAEVNTTAGGGQDREAELNTTSGGGQDREAEVNTSGGGGQDHTAADDNYADEAENGPLTLGFNGPCGLLPSAAFGKHFFLSLF